MVKEVELKLSLPEASQRSFLRHPLLKQAAAKRALRLVNLYYDTPDLQLRQRGIALRLRRQAGAWLQTVKCAGDSAGGLSSRPEWETPYGGQFDFTPVDDEAVRNWLQRPKIASRLIPVFETSFRRTVWDYPGVQLMFDRGWIVSSGRREAISELEIELAGDDIARLFELAQALAARAPLFPATFSKAERGYRLFQGHARAPAKATQVALDLAATTPLTAFRAIALACIEQLQANHDGALTSDDPEYIHQMRVATRRLRAATRVFAPLLGEAFLNTLVPPLRELMALLGKVRDLDVLLEEIVTPVTAALATEPRLAALAGVITEHRHRARSDTLHRLAAPAHGQSMLHILAMVTALEDNPAAPPEPLGEFAHRRLRRLRRKVEQLAAAARPDDPVSLHALRIGVKRLRYALEFFTPAAAGKRRSQLADRLAETQTTLGQLNDLANAGRLLMDSAGDDLALREAVTLIGGWHGPRHAQLMASLPQLINELGHLK